MISDVDVVDEGQNIKRGEKRDRTIFLINKFPETKICSVWACCVPIGIRRKQNQKLQTNKNIKFEDYISTTALHE